MSTYTYGMVHVSDSLRTKAHHTLIHVELVFFFLGILSVLFLETVLIVLFLMYNKTKLRLYWIIGT